MDTPISTIKSIQNPIISKTLECTVLDYRKSSKPDPAHQSLHLLVERCTGGSEAFRIQISHETDLSFLYREEITHSKFQSLANDWRLSRDLRNDINEFFQCSLREMITGSKVDVKVIVQQCGDTCILELETQEKLSMLKISVDLKLVAGEELVRFLMDDIMRLRRKVKKQADEISVKRKVEEEFAHAENSIKELTNRLKHVDEELLKKTRMSEKLDRQLGEKMNDLQLANDTIEELTTNLEEVKQDFSDAVKDIDEWKTNYNSLFSRSKQEINKRDREIAKMKQDLEKYDGIIAKYHSTPTNISESKFKELEISNRQKDEEINNLLRKNTECERSIEELMIKNDELSKKHQKNIEEIAEMQRFIKTQKYASIGQNFLFAPARQSASPKVMMPPVVGMPFTKTNREVLGTSNLPNLSTKIITHPVVPSSLSETPILDQERRRREQLAKANGK